MSCPECTRRVAGRKIKVTIPSARPFVNDSNNGVFVVVTVDTRKDRMITL
jgi:hypothetical protein